MYFWVPSKSEMVGFSLIVFDGMRIGICRLGLALGFTYSQQTTNFV